MQPTSQQLYSRLQGKASKLLSADIFKDADSASHKVGAAHVAIEAGISFDETACIMLPNATSSSLCRT